MSTTAASLLQKTHSSLAIYPNLNLDLRWAVAMEAEDVRVGCNLGFYQSIGFDKRFMV